MSEEIDPYSLDDIADRIVKSLLPDGVPARTFRAIVIWDDQTHSKGIGHSSIRSWEQEKAEVYLHIPDKTAQDLIDNPPAYLKEEGRLSQLRIESVRNAQSRTWQVVLQIPVRNKILDFDS